MSRDDWKTEPGGADDVRYIVAASIRELRAGKGWTQEQMAAAMRAAGLSWTRDTVSNTDRGLRPLELSELLAMAAVFGVPVVDIVAPRSASVDYEIETGVSRRAVRELLRGKAPTGPDEQWPAAEELLRAWGEAGEES